MENSEKAKSLYEQGLLALNRQEKDTLQYVAETWSRAIKLYRESGDENKAAEIRDALLKLYKNKRIVNYFKTEEQPSNGAAAVNRFKDWWMFLKIGCFGFGGPMAVFSLLQDELVTRKQLISNKDFLEGAVLGDILPGPVTMDIVTYTGFKLKKWQGALIASLLFILPSFILMLLCAIFYDNLILLPKVVSVFQCMGAAVTGLIISVGIKLGENEIKDYYAVGILTWAFISSLIFRFDIVWVVGLSGMAGMLLYIKGGAENNGRTA